MTRVLIIGTGDMGERFAAGLAASPLVHELVLTDISDELAVRAATISSSFDCTVAWQHLDSRDQLAVERVLNAVRPDLVVQASSAQSPWALVGRDDPVARGMLAAGLGLRLPLQLPGLMTVMQAAREVGYAGPIANISLPDLTHPVLATIGLAPTIGLGNVSMQLVRVRSALRARIGPDATMPLVRVVGQHSHVFTVMAASAPADPADAPMVWIGDDGQPHDALAFESPPIPAGIRYNAITAASALPVLLAMLPGAGPVRWSTPSPFGLPGGFPVVIDAGRIELDLPPGIDCDTAVAHCLRAARADGVERIDADGTVHFTDGAKAAVEPFAPDLAEPLAIDDLVPRADRLLQVLAAGRSVS